MNKLFLIALTMTGYVGALFDPTSFKDKVNPAALRYAYVTCFLLPKEQRDECLDFKLDLFDALENNTIRDFKHIDHFRDQRALDPVDCTATTITMDQEFNQHWAQPIALAGGVGQDDEAVKALQEQETEGLKQLDQACQVKIEKNEEGYRACVQLNNETDTSADNEVCRHARYRSACTRCRPALYFKVNLDRGSCYSYQRAIMDAALYRIFIHQELEKRHIPMADID